MFYTLRKESPISTGETGTRYWTLETCFPERVFQEKDFKKKFNPNQNWLFGL